ncbi:Conserved hypothetical protein (N-terminal part) [Pyrococcus abyssi GE5]|uniref:Uncharacterized protein n=1 Tax=Pyrococcus abyssi (strain GE5 / Orsay) TaxID=272844 RepID=Q8J2X6_PYRAB|nr:Conserved hypothetical protein (N-terminal part) [Pyrococcus abyssi GE5]CCE70093.1 TPA: hypothetical protein PABs11404 [Pyrococcus abyssi GE5]
MIGVVSFTDPRETALSDEREKAIMEKHNYIIKELSEFEVLDINKELGKPRNGIFGINSIKEAITAGRIAKERGVSGVIIGL